MVRDAATVVLLRDGSAGIEAWLLTRVSQMAFAAGMSVFPGGRVEPEDAALPFTEAGAGGAALRFACDEPAARAFIGAAVRETFEETGVLLSTPVADLSGARGDVETGRVPFGRLLRSNGLVIDAAVLAPWSRWITPPGESRRYDTRFFLGAMPLGAQAREGTSESVAASWVTPADALAQADRGERLLLPPTMVTLGSLLPYPTVGAAMAAAAGRTISSVEPVIHIEGDQVVAELPDGTEIRLPASMFAHLRGPGR